MDEAYEVVIGETLYLVSWGGRRVVNPSGRDCRWERYCEIQKWFSKPGTWDDGTWGVGDACSPAVVEELTLDTGDHHLRIY